MKTLKQIFLTLAACLFCVGCQEVDEPANTIPTVKTNEVTEVGAREAHFEGTVSTDQAECYFLLSTSPDLTDAEKIFREYTEEGGIRIYYGGVYELDPATTYYVALCATDGRSEVRGNVVQFTTLANLSIESVTYGGDHLGYDIVGFYLTDASNDILPHYGNMMGERAADYSYKLPYDITLTEPSYMVYAYTPYNKENSYDTLDGVSVWTDGRTDYLYGSCEVTPSNPKANIAMKSALSKVTFEITTESETEIVFSYVNLRNYWNAAMPDNKEPFAISGTLDLSTGVITPIEVSGHDGILIETADNVVYAGKSSTIDMLVIPTTFEDGEVLVNVCVGGQVYGTNLPATTWEAGKQYTYKVNLEIGKLTIGNVTVEEWNNNDGGTIHINQ